MRRVFVVVAALALCAYAQEEGAEEEKIEENKEESGARHSAPMAVRFTQCWWRR